MSELITVTIVDHVADVRLNRPEKMNSLSLAMIDALSAIAETLSENQALRAVVISGNGKCFCAGLDLSCLNPTEEFLKPFVDGSGDYPNRYQRAAYAWKKLPIPVIVAIHGAAFGGGLQVALGADIRIAHPQSKLSMMEIKWGLIPDMAGVLALRNLVRQDVAKELIFSGRIVSGEEAQLLGLVTKLSETPRQEALAIATKIASFNPDAISASKYLLEEAWGEDEITELKMEERLQADIIASPNQLEAVACRQQNRACLFKPRKFASFQALKDRLRIE